MGHEEELVRLEQVVTRLLASYDTLKAEYRDLQARLQASEQTNRDLAEQIENLREDREVMHSRVASLIDRIEEWEKDQDADVAVAAEPEGDDPQAEEDSMPIFSMAESKKEETPAG